LRPTNDPMHGFAVATLRRTAPGAITEWLNWGTRGWVAGGLLQIQHRFGNQPLIGVKRSLPTSFNAPKR